MVNKVKLITFTTRFTSVHYAKKMKVLGIDPAAKRSVGAWSKARV